MIPKSSKNHPQIIQKPHQNHTKPMQKSSQNDPKTDPGGTWNRTRHLPDASPKAEHQPTGVHRPAAKTGLPRASYAPKSGVTTPSGLRRFFFQQKWALLRKCKFFVEKSPPCCPRDPFGAPWAPLGPSWSSPRAPQGLPEPLLGQGVAWGTLMGCGRILGGSM